MDDHANVVNHGDSSATMAQPLLSRLHQPSKALRRRATQATIELRAQIAEARKVAEVHQLLLNQSWIYQE